MEIGSVIIFILCVIGIAGFAGMVAAECQPRPILTSDEMLTFKANGTGTTDYKFTSIVEAMKRGQELVDSGLYWMIEIYEGSEPIMYYHKNHKKWEV